MKLIKFTVVLKCNPLSKSKRIDSLGICDSCKLGYTSYSGLQTYGLNYRTKPTVTDYQIRHYSSCQLIKQADQKMSNETVQLMILIQWM